MEIGAIIIAAVGSAGLFNLIQFLISRKDKRLEALKEIGSDIRNISTKIGSMEKDSCRTQMLVLMADYPDQTAEMMKLAQHYFADLKGDWYMTSLFSKWLKANHMDRPMWFEIGGEKDD